MTNDSGGSTSDKELFADLLGKLDVEGLPKQDDGTAYLDTFAFSAATQAAPGEAEVPTATKTENKELVDKVLSRYGEKLDRPTSLDFGDAVKVEGNSTTDEVDHRVQASSCFRGRVWSFTVRRKVKMKEDAESKLADWITKLKTKKKPGGEPFWKSGYEPSKFHFFKPGDDPTLASFDEICNSLLQLLGLDKTDSHLPGLVLLTGETSSGKSNIARGMVYNYLTSRDVSKKDRNPHLVTYEDPIEDWFFGGDLLHHDLFRTERRIDYTPRQKGVDCKGLKECTRAALRQTPTVFFAGEIRERSDLAEAVYFGGTGHLIIATAHAGSVVESADKILSALRVSNPFQRAVQVPKILGIIHLRKMNVEFAIDGVTVKSSMFVPSVYRRCSQGMQSFIADGLAALVPHCPPQGDNGFLSHGTLGRQYMVRRILTQPCQPQIVDGAEDGAKTWLGSEVWQQIREYHAGPVTHDESSKISAPKVSQHNPEQTAPATPAPRPSDPPEGPPGKPDEPAKTLPANSVAGNSTDQNNEAVKPLWIRCVQDDLRGMR